MTLEEIVPHFGVCACGDALTSSRQTWCSDRCRMRTRRTSAPQRPSEAGLRPERDRSQDTRRTHRAKDHVYQGMREPIGVDGEGEEGRYTLLAASTGDYVANREHGLGTQQCLEFLSSLPKGQTIWGFAFSYDVNMILRDLSREELTRLVKTNRVYWNQWNIHHIPGKLFKIINRDTKVSVSVWDMYPWVQSSFVVMLESYGIASDEVVDRIRSMKDQRNAFTEVDFERIKAYCIEECQFLSKGVGYLLDVIARTGFHLSSYYSPGTLAAKAMEHHCTRAHRSEPPTEEIVAAVGRAYYGGRSEVSRVGPTEGPIYEYDIHSAYPYAATLLPCMNSDHGGEWKPVKEIGPWSLVRVKWQTSRFATWGPYPMRPPTGSLRYPTSGTTWVWGVEALAGKPLCRRFNVVDGWTWHTTCDCKPFAWLGEYYKARAKLKEEGDPRQLVYKLILNSAYGKLAQHPSLTTYGKLAQHPSLTTYGHWQMPKQRYLPWAGLITATTRAMLLEQIVRHDESILLCATDGILSNEALTVTIGTELGQWETEQYPDIFIAGPGFYFTTIDDAGHSKIRNRGIARSDVPTERLREEWLHHGRMAEVRLRTRRFIGYRLALQRLQGLELWRHFTDVEMKKSIDVTPRRRWLSDDPFDGRSVAPTLQAHGDTAMHDMMEKVQLKFAFESYIADHDYEKASRLIEGMNPYDIEVKGLHDQPDYIIDAES